MGEHFYDVRCYYHCGAESGHNRENDMRVMMTAAIAGAAMCCASSAMAWEGNAPWCAYQNIGTGNVIERCVYRSVEECTPEVIAGNRGQCGPNPRFDWNRQSAPRKYRRHARR